mgnify:FL=1
MGNMVASIKEYLTGLTLPHMSWIDIIEILLIAVLVYQFMLWVRNTRLIPC